MANRQEAAPLSINQVKPQEPRLQSQLAKRQNNGTYDMDLPGMTKKNQISKILAGGKCEFFSILSYFLG